MLKTGQTIGKYLIDSKIGAGGMAVVYRALSPEEKVVAIKAMPETLATNPDAVARFEREARLIGRLDHPHIVRVMDFFIENEIPYMVMEYKEGGNLMVHLQRHRFMTLGNAAVILQQLASALDYAHKENIIHRDMKLENILLDAKGHPAISDFGLARAMDEATMTMSGSLLGTPYYMSPEQFQPTRYKIDHRTDYYALGVIAYVLATGQFPFNAGDAAAIMHQHIAVPPPAASDLNPVLPAELDHVLLRQLSKEAEDRYPTASAFAQEFAYASVQHLSLPIECKIVPRNSSQVTQPKNENATAIVTMPAQPSKRQMLTQRLLVGGVVGLMALVMVLAALLLQTMNTPQTTTDGQSAQTTGNPYAIPFTPAPYINQGGPGTGPEFPPAEELATLTLTNQDGPILVVFVDAMPLMILPPGYTGSMTVLKGARNLRVCDLTLRGPDLTNIICLPTLVDEVTGDLERSIAPGSFQGNTIRYSAIDPEATGIPSSNNSGPPQGGNNPNNGQPQGGGDPNGGQQPPQGGNNDGLPNGTPPPPRPTQGN